MSDSDSTKPNSKRGVLLALLCGFLWFLGIAAMWFLFKRGETSQEGGLLNWIARFHVLLVHLPIGMIILVVAMEFFGRFKGLVAIRDSIPFVLWMTLLSGIGATILGYLLMGVEDVAGKAMTLHLWTGLGVVVLSLFALIFKIVGIGFLYFLSLIASLVCVSAAGHYGGSMVHEADYLSEYGPEVLKPLILGGLADPKHHGEPEKNGEDTREGKEIPMEERNVYADFVVPILDKTCNECHNENKIKGKLRMDTHELLLAGAEEAEYPTVVPGNADESELIARVLLDPDDDDFMPPKGDGLTEEEIEVLELWIQAGAKKETTVAELASDPGMLDTFVAVEEYHSRGDVEEDDWEPVWENLSSEEQEARLIQAQADADKMNISMMPISSEDSRLQVNVLNGASEFGDEQLKLLEPVAEQIAWLDLAKSQVTDEGMKIVSHMRGLEKLYLQETKVTDAGIARLTPLKNLQYLNLFATRVTNDVFDSFLEMPGLRRIFLWETKVDSAAARSFEKSVNLEVNTGENPEAEKPVEEKGAGSP